MELGLEGKKALVTGSTAGIGLAIARGLAREGATSGSTAGRPSGSSGRSRRSAVPRPDGSRASPPTSPPPRASTRCWRRCADVDVLVNNLGIFEAKPFEQIPDADWLRFFETNVMSGVRLSRAYLPAMLRRSWGRILFVSSESAVQIPAEMIHYGMTKTAQVAVASGMAELDGGHRRHRQQRARRADRGAKASARSSRPWPVSAGRPPHRWRRSSSSTSARAACSSGSRLRTRSRPRWFTCSCAPASGTNGAAVRADGGVVRSIL